VYGLSSAATSQNGVSHWDDTKVIMSLVAAAVLLAAFAVIEVRSTHALLPIRVLRSRDRTGSYLISLCAAPRCSACSSSSRSSCRTRGATAPACGTVSLGKAALRPAATVLGAALAGDGIRVASITIAGQIRPGTPFSPDQIADRGIAR
jgi:hypothetical protein